MSASSDQVERELKLGAWPEFALPDLTGASDGLVAGAATRQELDAVYFDTPQLDLIRRGVTLRFRRGEPPADVWTVKLPSDAAAHGLARREITVPGGREAVPAQFADLTRGWALGRALRPIARVRTVRSNVPLCDASGNVLATLDDDAVTVLRGRHVLARFRELEVELVGDAPAAILTAADERLRAAGAEKVAQIPKLSRALGRAAAQPWQLAPVELNAKATMAEAANARLVEWLGELVDAHALVVLGVPGSAARALKALANLRAGLGAYADLLAEAPPKSVTDTLAWLEPQLALVAELDALLTRLAEQRPAGASGVTARVDRARLRAHTALVRALRDRRYGALLARLAAVAGAPAPKSGPGHRRVAASGRKLVRASWRTLRDERAANGGQLDPASLDSSLGRLSAVLELVSAAAAGDDAKPALDAVCALRAASAEHLESQQLVRRLRGLARRSDADESWACGVLAGRELARAEASQVRFSEAWEQLVPKSTWSWAG
jgi:inorganic triphosphatase YgiF